MNNKSEKIVYLVVFFIGLICSSLSIGFILSINAIDVFFFIIAIIITIISLAFMIGAIGLLLGD